MTRPWFVPVTVMHRHAWSSIVSARTKRTPGFALCSSSRLRRLHTVNTAIPPLAFVFDIDGVLLQGPKVLPAAKRALSMLEGNNPFGLKIPYILLTNGGGVGEEERCHKLTTQLGTYIRPSQYIQAHTILKTHAHRYAEKPVLVLGGKLDTVRRVAEGYGFRKVYTTIDVLAWNPAVWPFHRLSEDEVRVAKQVDFSTTPIAAAFVFHDPRNWALDVQVLCDIILSNGIIGGPPANTQPSSTPPVELIFCNPDLLWRSDFPRPRLGQGAFKEAFQSVFKALTGSTYPYVQYGKPTPPTYAFAEKVMNDRLRELYHVHKPMPNIYMVGDNPESDIAGANGAGWPSVLVHTGVYDPEQDPVHKPTHQAVDVEAAVKWAIEREITRSKGDVVE